MSTAPGPRQSTVPLSSLIQSGHFSEGKGNCCCKASLQTRLTTLPHVDLYRPTLWGKNTSRIATGRTPGVLGCSEVPAGPSRLPVSLGTEVRPRTRISASEFPSSPLAQEMILNSLRFSKPGYLSRDKRVCLLQLEISDASSSPHRWGPSVSSLRAASPVLTALSSWGCRRAQCYPLHTRESGTTSSTLREPRTWRSATSPVPEQAGHLGSPEIFTTQSLAAVTHPFQSAASQEEEAVGVGMN